MLDNVAAHAVGIRGLGVDPHEARPGEHLGRADVVFGDASEQGPVVSNRRNVLSAAEASPRPQSAGSIQQVTSRWPSMVKLPTVPAKALSTSIARSVTSVSLRMRW